MPEGGRGRRRRLDRVVRHQRRQHAGRHRRGGGPCEGRSEDAAGDSLPQRLRAGGGQYHGGGGERRPPGAGHHQRLRRALRQPEPVLGAAQPPVEAGLQVCARVAVAPAAGDLAPGLRAGQRGAGQAAALRGRERVRAQGRAPRVRHHQEPRDLRAHRAGAGGQPPARAGVGPVRPQQHRLQGAGIRHRPERPGPGRPPDTQPDQGAGEPGLRVRGRGGVLRAADPGGAGEEEAQLPPRRLPGHRREAGGGRAAAVPRPPSRWR